MKKLCIIFALTLFSLPSFSAVILKIKDKKALIDLEGTNAHKGDQFEALNLYGKVKGILEIKKVKKGKAIGILRKGTMGVSWILEPKSEYVESSESKPPLQNNYVASATVPREPESREVQKSSSHSIGFLVGPDLNFVRLSAGTSIFGVSWRGSSFIDFAFNSNLSIRLSLGYKALVIEGRDCNRIIQCKLFIHYPGSSALLKVKLIKYSKVDLWLGAGGSLLWPMPDRNRTMGLNNKSFTGFHGALKAALGTDIILQNIQIPVQIDFNWINPVVMSSQFQSRAKKLKPFYIGLQLGVSFAF